MKKLVTLLWCLLPLAVIGQVSQNQNYLHTTTYQEELDETESLFATEDEKIETVTYYDGLGRPKQSIQIRGGGDKEDIIAPVIYDAFGRTTRNYLPYASSGNNAAFKDQALEELEGFYNTPKYQNTLNPFSETILEVSPANRVQEQAAPGAAWAYDGENLQYENPVYAAYPATSTYQKFWQAHKLFYIPGGFPGPDDDDPIDLTNNYVKIIINNGTLTLDIRAYDKDMINTLPTGRLERLDIYPEIELLNLGAINDASGNPTYYEVRIEKNYLVISQTQNHPAPTNGLISTHTYDLTQLQVLTDYDAVTSASATTKAAYGLNASSEVARFDVVMTGNNSQQPTLVANNYYSAGELIKTTSKDENWRPGDGLPRTTETFTDKNGKVILTRSYTAINSTTSETHDTYNIYDDFGNLTYVIPPKVNITDGVSTTELSELCYQYIYDERNRLIEKKTPGKGWEYIVYNNLDMPILTQDTKQKSSDQWLFTKYDAFGRVAYTGMYESPQTRSEIQTEVDTEGRPVYEKRTLNQVSSSSAFTDVVAVQINGSTITRVVNTQDGNDGGLATLENIPGDGYLKFTTADVIGLTVAGLSNTNADTSLYTVQYGIGLFFGGLYVYENGIFTGNFGNYQAGDMFKVERVGTTIHYKKNEEIFYTSTVASTGALIGDIGMNNEGTTLEGVALESIIEETTPFVNTTIYYKNEAFPYDTTLIEVLTVNYYDDYGFDIGDLTSPGTVFNQPVTDNVRGLPTGSIINVLGTEDWITTVSYYDEKARPVYTVSENTHLNTKDITKTAYNFDGTVERSQEEHTKDGVTVVTNERMTYDHMNRTKAVLHRVNNQEEKLISENYYDELGRLEKKDVGGIKPVRPTTFTDLVEVVVDGNNITKTSVFSPNGGFATVESLSGDGYITFTAAQDDKILAVGLSPTNTDTEFNSIEYAIYLNNLGNVKVMEAGSTIGTYGTYQTGDVFKIERVGNVISFYKNNIALYTSKNPAPGTLIGDGTLHTHDAGITNVRLHDATLPELPNQNLQTIDYTYNIRGWMTDINDVNSLGEDLFAFKVGYEDPSYYIAGDNQNWLADPLYNGNISETQWRTANDDIKRGYGYEYDALDRITEAYFAPDSKYNLNTVSYDKNGNILRLQRGLIKSNGGPLDPPSTMVDDLIYTYDSGNKLTGVREGSLGLSNEGFHDGNTSGNDYSYDDNGNMTLDRNKGITAITYNHLNLPNQVTVANGSNNGNITYIYDAVGNKLKKGVTREGSFDCTEYAGKYVYGRSLTHTVIKFIRTSEGYIEPQYSLVKPGSGEIPQIIGVNYVYQFTDHLGNIRLSYSDKDDDRKIDVLRNNVDIDGDSDNAHEILEENNYYPFGLQHKGYNNTIATQEHPYKYNGQEFTQDMGVNLYEMPLRAFDPAIARWNRIDPVTHYAMSTYNAFDNNPIVYADPSGGDSWGVSGGNHYGIYGSTGSAIYWGAGDSFQNNGLNASDFTSFGSDVGAGLAAAGFFPDNNFIPSNSNGDSNKSFFYVDLNHDITEQEAEAFLNQSSEGDCCQWFTDILDKTWGNIERNGWQSEDAHFVYWLGNDGFTYGIDSKGEFWKVGFNSFDKVNELPPLGEEPIPVGFGGGASGLRNISLAGLFSSGSKAASYSKVFYAAYPRLKKFIGKGLLEIHHRIPQRYITSGLFPETMRTSLSNLQGLPRDIHRKIVTPLWNSWARKNPNATQADVMRFANKVDDIIRPYINRIGR